jgi:hypothetical protein
MKKQWYRIYIASVFFLSYNVIYSCNTFCYDHIVKDIQRALWKKSVQGIAFEKLTQISKIDMIQLVFQGIINYNIVHILSWI